MSSERSFTVDDDSEFGTSLVTGMIDMNRVIENMRQRGTSIDEIAGILGIDPAEVKGASLESKTTSDRDSGVSEEPRQSDSTPHPDMEVLCGRLVETMARREAKHVLDAQLTSLPASALQAAAQYVEKAPDLPVDHAVSVLVMAAERSSDPQMACRFATSALGLDPKSAEAKKVLLDRAMQGLDPERVDCVKEVAVLFTRHDMPEQLAKHHELLLPHAPVCNMCPKSIKELANHLGTQGRNSHAADVMVQAASMLDESGHLEEAFECFQKALGMDCANASAVSGLSRLGEKCGHPWEAGIGLLESLPEQDTTALARRAAEAARLFGAHCSAEVAKVRAELSAELAALRAEVSAERVHREELKSKVSILSSKVLDDTEDALCDGHVPCLAQVAKDVSRLKRTKVGKDMYSLSGFKKAAMNGDYVCDPLTLVNGAETYWNEYRSFFIYRPHKSDVVKWLVSPMSQKTFDEIACGLKSVGLARSLTDEWAVGRWEEWNDEKWVTAQVTVGSKLSDLIRLQRDVAGLARRATLCTSFCFYGFSRPEMNVVYTRDNDLIINGRETYWGPYKNYFVYRGHKAEHGGHKWWLASKKGKDYENICLGKISVGMGRCFDDDVTCPGVWEDLTDGEFQVARIHVECLQPNAAHSGMRFGTPLRKPLFQTA